MDRANERALIRTENETSERMPSAEQDKRKRPPSLSGDDDRTSILVDQNRTRGLGFCYEENLQGPP